MIKLNLPEYEIKIKTECNNAYLFDIVRKKYILFSPEEWVRQNFLHYLVYEKKFPVSLISIEHYLIINKFSRRCDIVLFDNNAKPLIIVECKSPNVKISQKTFNQAAGYNMKLNVKFLILTNGLLHYCCKIETGGNNIINMLEIPSYDYFRTT
jgi:hypothetical protein